MFGHSVDFTCFNTPKQNIWLFTVLEIISAYAEKLSYIELLKKKSINLLLMTLFLGNNESFQTCQKPHIIYSDTGKQFTSQEFTHFLQTDEIQSSVGYQVLKKFLRIAQYD